MSSQFLIFSWNKVLLVHLLQETAVHQHQLAKFKHAIQLVKLVEMAYL